MNIELKLVEVNTGYCRILYKTKNQDNQNIYYSLQDDWPNQPLVMYRNTQPPWCEPEYPVKFKDSVKIYFELPTGDSKLEIKAREYISLLNEVTK